MLSVDITCLCETKLDDVDSDSIEKTLKNCGLEVKFKNHKNISNWRSGGLCVIYKSEQSSNIQFVPSQSKLVQWFSITKDLLQTDKNLMIGNVYIPPEGTRYQHDDPVQEIEDEMLDLKGDNYFCLTGDFNAHTKTLQDFVEADELMLDQLEYDVDMINILNDVKLLNAIGIPLTRCNPDTKRTNNYGHRLIEYCKSHGMLIMNGRMGKDTVGKCTSTDQSVIDYVIAEPAILARTSHFYVEDFDGLFSDKHCKVKWSLKCKDISYENTDEQNDKVKMLKTHRSMWSDDKKQHFVANIKPEWEQGLITDIDNSDYSIDAICDKLKNVFLEAANATLGQEKEIVINTKTKKHKPWFNNEVKEMRQTYNRARRQNKMQKNENSKNNLKKVSKSYKKLVNKEKAKFKKAQIQKLKYAKSKNPKFYWSVINKRSRSQMNLPSIMEFYSSFKKLAGKPENTDDSDTVESVNQQRVLNIEENEILNGEFTNEEILKCI